MRAVNRLRIVALLAVAAATLAVVGCDTTADKNVRAKLAADRELAIRKKLIVKKQDPRIEVETVQVVGKGKRAAFVVVINNSHDEALSDLPVNVGVTRGGRRKILNSAANTYYFYKHIPSAAAGKQTIWVAPLGRRVPKGKPFAIVGEPRQPQRAGQFVPTLNLTGVQTGRTAVTGTLVNDTGLPQYLIELYATVKRGDRFVAAGRNRAVRLGNGERQAFAIPLVGRPGRDPGLVTYGLAVLPTE